MKTLMKPKQSPKTMVYPWYKIKLTLSEVESGEMDILRGAFSQVYIASNAPIGMALLTDRNFDRQDGCFLYLTPRSLPHAMALVKAYSALPQQETPVRRRLVCLSGDPNSVRDDVVDF